MDDAELQEWKRQRALVAEHLAWIDARIAEASDESAEREPAVERPDRSSTEPSPYLQKAGLTHPFTLKREPAPENAPEPPFEEAIPEAPGVPPAPSVEEIARQYGGGKHGIGQSEKLGCFLILGLLILATLFVVFVLPYLIIPNEEDELPESEPIQSPYNEEGYTPIDP